MLKFSSFVALLVFRFYLMRAVFTIECKLAKLAIQRLSMQCLKNICGLQMFFKVDALKNLVILTEKNLCWSLFLIKLQAFSPHSDWIRRDARI